MILPNDGACYFVFRRKDDWKFSFAINIGVDESTSYPHEAFLVDERVMRSESFRAFFYITPGVRSVDVFHL